MRLIACRNDAGAPALGARVGDELVDLAAMGLRYPSSRVAHGEALVRPHVSTQFDYEAELVAVIGKGGRYIRKGKALEHVAGYSLFNDGSIRDHQFRSNQWMMGKNGRLRSPLPESPLATPPNFLKAERILNL